ncbi:MAG: 6,7-dimethyl-8-ribityllumazine synthase [Actinobacteria bacterium]|nr:6,7-dimethyl-8-ribityllumazine synthase [Actinomycetota bacterium]
MSGVGAPEASVDGRGMRIAVVAATWHDRVVNGLLEGAVGAASQSGAEIEIYRVPGSFELSVVARRAAESGFDAVVALGVIIRGGTPHFEYVSAGVTQGLSQVAVLTGVPVTFGILTCDDEEQALDRAGLPGSREDKGREAMQAAIATTRTLAEVGSARKPYAGFSP